MSKEKLIIFDTTMRDGEQSPGASMTKEEKLRIARQLERMRVDVIEAGFPAASDGDFESVKAVARGRARQHRMRSCACERKGRPPLRRSGAEAPNRRACIRSSRRAPSTWKRSCAWSRRR